jgi:hypothetical protein
MSKMTESELKAILSAEIADSIGHIGGELSEQRRKALDYYLGQPFGNEIEGRSKVVSTDVADTIEWILPSLLRIFTAGDDVVRYEPTGPEDEEVARQATEYAKWNKAGGRPLLGLTRRCLAEAQLFLEDL